MQTSDIRLTKVQFLFEKGSKSKVWALFPDTKYIRPSAGSDTVIYECYAHIGQHSECTEDYVKECLPATRGWKSLKSELESIGYNLQVI